MLRKRNDMALLRRILLLLPFLLFVPPLTLNFSQLLSDDKYMPLCSLCKSYNYNGVDYGERARFLQSHKTELSVLIRVQGNDTLACNTYSSFASMYGLTKTLSMVGASSQDAYHPHNIGEWAISNAISKGFELSKVIDSMFATPYVHAYGNAGIIHGAVWHAIATMTRGRHHDVTAMSLRLCPISYGAMRLYDCFHGVGHGTLIITLQKFQNFQPLPCKRIVIAKPLKFTEMRYGLSFCNFTKAWMVSLCSGGFFHAVGHGGWLSPTPRDVLWPCDLLTIGVDGCILWRLFTLSSRSFLHMWDPRSICFERKQPESWVNVCITIVSKCFFLQFDAFEMDPLTDWSQSGDGYLSDGTPNFHARRNLCCALDMYEVDYNGRLSYIFGSWNRTVGVQEGTLPRWCSLFAFSTGQFDEDHFYSCIIGSVSVPAELVYHDPAMILHVQHICEQLALVPFLSLNQQAHSREICLDRIDGVSRMLSNVGEPIAFTI